MLFNSKAYLFLFAFLLISCAKENNHNTSWKSYRATPDVSQFSSLAQIDTTNVHLLRPVWTYSTGDADKACLDV